VLSRLLQPDDFCLLAMVMPAYGLAVLVQDLGLSQAAVQVRHLTGGQAATLFWVNVGISIGLAAVLAVVAPGLALFYGEPRIAGLTQAFAAIVVLSGLAAQQQALLNRQMRFGFIAAIDSGSYLAGFAAGVLTALAVHNYWALFVSPAVSGVVTLAMSWTGTRWRPGWPWRCRDAAGLLRFGGGLAGFNAFEFFVRSMDNILIGRVWGNAALGVYDRAYKLLLFPLEQVGGPLSRVMLPVLARLADEPARYRHAYLRAVQQMLLISQPGIVFMAATADTLVPAVLGEPWRASAPIFQWLGLAALAQPMTGAIGWLLISQGRTRALMGWGAFSAATCAGAFVAGLPWGPAGVAAAYSITEIVPRLPLYAWLGTSSGPVRLSDLVRTAGPFLAADAAALLAVLAFRHDVAWPAIPELLACLALSYATSVLSLLILPGGRSTLRESMVLLAPLESQVRRHWTS
jgi:PST family polysaccharide transporter